MQYIHSRFTAVFLALVLLFSIASCSQGPPIPAGGDVQSSDTPSGTAQTTRQPDEGQRTEITLLAVGDNLIHDTVYNAMREGGSYDFHPMFTKVKPWIESADVAFINQETPLAGADYAPSSYPCFNSPQELGIAVMDTGFDVVNQANNHGLDKGMQGLLNTAEFWAQYPQITLIGINRSAQERTKVRLREVKGVTFAWLSYSYGTNGITMPEPYLMNLIDMAQIRQDIAEAKKVSDAIIVSMHWGNEYQLTPSTDQENLAQMLADEGVLLVIGHHPHVLQPAAWITGKDGNQTFVTYSLGNFISSQSQIDRMLGGMLSCTILVENGKISVTNPGVIPLVTHFNDAFQGYCSYPLSQYNNTLGAAHRGNRWGKAITVEYFHTLAAQVLGSYCFEAPGKALHADGE